MYTESYLRSDVDNARIKVYHQAGLEAYQNAPILIVHATGFHARCWDEVVKQLPDFNIYLVDLRCHGQSDNTAFGDTWDIFAADLKSVIQQLKLSNIFGIGHSKGGHQMLQIAGELPKAFGHVFAFDPVVFDTTWPAVKDMMPPNTPHPVASRRNVWTSTDEFYQVLHTKPPFDTWNQQVLKDYCQYGLVLSNNEEHMELACPPESEAQIYLTSCQKSVRKALHIIECPVTIFRARERTAKDALLDFRPSATDRNLVDAIANAKDVHLTDNSHFIPMEIPHAVADWIKEEHLNGGIQNAEMDTVKNENFS